MVAWRRGVGEGPKGIDFKEAEGTFGDDRYVLSLDGGDAFTEGRHMSNIKVHTKKIIKIPRLRNLLMQSSVQDTVQGVKT